MHKALADRILEHVRAFAEPWYDGHGGLIAVAARPRPDAAIVVRSHGGHSGFRDADGRLRAVVGRGWALVGPGVAPAPWLGRTAGFAGTVRSNEVPRIMAALAEMGASHVAVAGEAAARFFTAALGREAVHRTITSPAVARALVRAGRFVVAAFDPSSAWGGYRREIPVADAVENLRRIEEWGVPPPGRSGSAIRAYASTLVHSGLRTVAPEPALLGRREDLVEAIREWSRGFPVTLAEAEDGSVWRVHHVTHHVLRMEWGVRGVAFPGVRPRKPIGNAGRIRVAPARDIAVLGTRDKESVGFLARRSLPVLYGELAALLRSGPPRVHDVHVVALALGIATARIDENGPMTTVRGIYIHAQGPRDCQPLPA